MSDLYQKNLSVIKEKDPSLAERLEKAFCNDKVKIIQGQSGDPVPAIFSEGREYPLHSKYRPVEEGVRLSQKYSEEGTLIFLGFGAGYHIEPFIRSSQTESMYIVIPDITLFKCVLSIKDLSLFFNDPRICFFVEEESSFIVQTIKSRYIPILSGSISTIPLNSVIRFYNGKLQSVFTGITELIDDIRSDFSVQHHFGKQWFHNSLKNIIRWSDSGICREVSIPSQVVITAAGPSLEKQLSLIINEYSDRFLIATDTSVPFLLKNNVKPDLIVSIDCQVISRSHFISCDVKNIPVILDISSSGAVVDSFNHPIFCGSRHPFIRYLTEVGWDIPLLDFSGGSVTHAAVEIARKAGVQSIILAGADFAYPKGKSYAKGTHLYDWFNIRAERMSPLEGGFFSLFMRTPFERRPAKGGDCYVSERMDSYKNALELLADRFSADCLIEAPEGEGQTLMLPKKTLTKIQSGEGKIGNRSVPSPVEVSKFLNNLLSDLQKIHLPERLFISELDELSTDQRNLLLTFVPYAAHFTGEDPSDIFSKAKISAVEFISKIIDSKPA